MEPYRLFHIDITLPSGGVLTDRQLAVSIWHAIDKAYTKHSAKQSDRLKYKIKKSLLRV